jgi:hypothetical protein
MAKNRKKQRLEMGTAGGSHQPAAKAKPAAKVAPAPPPKGPATQPKKPKVKRPKYVRPPRAPAKPKPPEPTGPKPLTYAAITMTSGVAKAIPKPGVELPDRPGPGLR